MPNSHGQAEILYGAVAERLKNSMPKDANIQHIGATAVSNCLTKGDLDICVRVKSEDFLPCDVTLAQSFARNTNSETNEFFSSFKNEQTNPPLGIQLVVIGSPLDTFVKFRDLLNSEKELREHYNQLKLYYNGKPMQNYRRAKNDFIEKLLTDLVKPL
jgi:GrpB-like predicted nucleotidyltransferase (UPF0157 family)